MHLTLKLAAAIFGGLCVILAINVYVGVNLLAATAEEDAARDQEVMASAIAASVEAVWKSYGRTQALRIIETADRRDPRVAIRWVDLRVPPEPGRGPRMAVTSEMIARQNHLVNIEQTGDGKRTLHSYGAINLDGESVGAVEISEVLTDERQFVSRLLIATAVTGLVIAIVSAILALFLGQRWIAVPIRRLIDLTHRVAGGDFSVHASVTGSGEIVELAEAMNGMSRDLEQAMEQLRHADRVNTVGKLSTGVAHELGTPLHVALGRAKSICEDPYTPEHIRGHAETIARQGHRMSEIIRQLLTFAHVKNLIKRPTDIISVITEAAAMVSPMATKRQVEVVLPSSGEPQIVEVDSTQMHQVVSNLLINAIQASSPLGRVTLVAERRRTAPFGRGHGESQEYVVFSVKDEGIGIAPDSMPNLFEPFFTTKEVGEGTGLGLSVALGIVREHGGWIDADSDPGAGSHFTVFLPTS